MNNGKEEHKAVIYSPPNDPIPPLRPDDPGVIPLFLGCDEKFLPHSLEVIASFMSHAKPDEFYDIFILEADIPRERLDIATAWMQRYPNASLRFVELSHWIEHIRSELVVTKEFPVAVYFRLFAPGIFLQYDKMAYLDSDIAVLDNIAGFYRQDLEGLPVGAVEDRVSMHQATVNPAVEAFWADQLGKKPGEKYFYSGGLVMDLNMMRSMNIEKAFTEKARIIKGCKLPDQDVMNAVLNHRIKSIPLEWNCLDWMCDPEEGATNYRLMNDAGLNAVRNARSRFRVIHYAEKKPWTMDYQGKYAEYYWRYAAETPFYHQVRDALLQDSGSVTVTARILLTYLQQVNFTIRTLLCSGKKREKYVDRINKLIWKRKGLIRQKKFIKEYLQG